MVAEYAFSHLPNTSENPKQTMLGDHEYTLPSRGLIEACSACSAGMKLVEDLFRSEFAQLFTMRVLEDACWLASFAVSHDSCALTVE